MPYSPDTVQKTAEDCVTLAASLREYIKAKEIQRELKRLVMGKKILPLINYFEKQNMSAELKTLDDSLCLAFLNDIPDARELYKLSGFVEEETVKMRIFLREHQE